MIITLSVGTSFHGFTIPTFSEIYFVRSNVGERVRNDIVIYSTVQANGKAGDGWPWP